jgi:hypothetical protein
MDQKPIPRMPFLRKAIAPFVVLVLLVACSVQDTSMAAAMTSLKQSRATGIFGAPTARVDEAPGGVVSVSITWVYPSIFGGLCNFFGHVCPDRFQGTAISVWKKEGW